MYILKHTWDKKLMYILETGGLFKTYLRQKMDLHFQKPVDCLKHTWDKKWIYIFETDGLFLEASLATFRCCDVPSPTRSRSFQARRSPRSLIKSCATRSLAIYVLHKRETRHPISRSEFAKKICKTKLLILAKIFAADLVENMWCRFYMRNFEHLRHT
jgi:hypothetical protein